MSSAFFWFSYYDDMKYIYILQNHLQETPGRFGAIFAQYKLPFQVINLAAGEALPDLAHCRALVVLGGADSANDTTAKIQVELQYIRRALKAGIPYFGVCLGLQLAVKACGGSVMLAPVPEHGLGTVNITTAGQSDPLLTGIDTTFPVFQLHNETVMLDKGMTLISSGVVCPNQIVRLQTGAYGLQCHIEVTPELLETWLRCMPDLQKYPAKTIQTKFMAEYATYERNGERLIINWLRTTKLLAV